MDDKKFLILSLSLFVIALVFAGFMIRFGFTGFATANGTIYINITPSASINFTTNTINFGNGSVTAGTSQATLDTSGAGSVTNGSWTPVSSGFVVKNIGNQNVSLALMTGKTAATFIGGTSPSYQYNVSNVNNNSCLNSTGTGTTGLSLGTYVTVNTTSPGDTVCGVFRYLSTNNTIRIDIKLVVPQDALAASLNDTMTATFSGVP